MVLLATRSEVDDGRRSQYNFLTYRILHTQRGDYLTPHLWPPELAAAIYPMVPHLGQTSRVQGQEKGEEDYVNLLDEEALELVQFEPAVDDEDTWKACDTIINFIKKAFNEEIKPTTREGIMKDYPKPKIEALFAPKLDDDVKRQIEMAGKDPHYGV